MQNKERDSPKNTVEEKKTNPDSRTDEVWRRGRLVCAGVRSGRDGIYQDKLGGK